MSAFIFETDQIRAFVAAPSLCELRVAFAFFALKFPFGNAEFAKQNPSKTAKACISNFVAV